MRYAVHFIKLAGDVEVVQVVTDRGPVKAVHLASANLRNVLKKPALDVRVDLVGPAELDQKVSHFSRAT